MCRKIRAVDLERLILPPSVSGWTAFVYSIAYKEKGITLAWGKSLCLARLFAGISLAFSFMVSIVLIYHF
jgi:hypothetical protein